MDKQQKKARIEQWQDYESPFYRRWRVYSTFLTGFAIGLFYVLLISEQDVFNFGDDGQRAVVLIFSGILGGVIYTIMIDGHVEMPQFIANRGDKFRAGLFGDILLGIAGAIVLDFIAQTLPGVDLSTNVEVAAAGIVGGYGGRAILKFALERVFKDINLLEADRIAYLQANMQRQLDRMDSLELLDLVNQQIREGLTGNELSTLSREIEEADTTVRRRIFNLVRDFRLAAKAAGERDRIKRMLPLFEALLKGDLKQHAYYAELAFAYKDSGTDDFFQPLQYLDQAINLRGNRQRAETWNYELSRAITRIQQAYKQEKDYKFSPQTEALIIQDLLAVSSIYNFETLLKDIENDNIPLPLLNWARHNKAQLLSRDDTADLGLKITNFLEAESSAVSAQPTDTIVSTDTPSTPRSSSPEAEQTSHVQEGQKINRSIFFKEYRNIFPVQKLSQDQVDVFEAIFDYWDKSNHIDLRWLSYAMATAYHETGTRMVPIREGFADDDASAIKAVERLLARGYIRWNYAKPEANGQSYFGRGLVQITHQENYLKLGKAIGRGTELKDNPSLALDTEISVQLLFKGMVDGLYVGGHKLSVYFNKQKEDWYGARTMINGDKHIKPNWANGKSIGQLVEKYGRDFYRCCKASAIDLSSQASSPLTTTEALPSKKQLAVRYFSQRDNAAQSSRTCNTASCWMGAVYVKSDLWQKSNKNENGDLDYYLPIVNKYGKTTSHEAQTDALKELGIQSEWRRNLTIEDVKREIDQERPVVLGIFHNGHASSPTHDHGHMILAVGYDEKSLLIHDPNGELDVVQGGYNLGSTRGDFLHYSYKNLRARFEADGPGTGWGRLFR